MKGQKRHYLNPSHAFSDTIPRLILLIPASLTLAREVHRTAAVESDRLAYREESSSRPWPAHVANCSGSPRESVSDAGESPVWLLSCTASSVPHSVRLWRWGGSQPSIFSSFFVGEICRIVIVMLSQKQWPFSGLSFLSFSSSLFFLCDLWRQTEMCTHESHWCVLHWGLTSSLTSWTQTASAGCGPVGRWNFPRTVSHCRFHLVFPLLTSSISFRVWR